MQEMASAAAPQPDGRPDAGELIACVEAYFASADRCDVAATLAAMAPDCVMEYLTEGLRYEGRDAGIKAYFEARARNVVKSWHGNFRHVADAAAGRVATRFAVRRTDKGGVERTGDNIDLFEFEGRRIKRITVWKSAPKAP
jgi:ketosteroid isomerase-like protein